MDRKQLYNEITSLGLQEEVKSRFGKNYTMCSNADLQKLVDEVHKGMAKAAKPVEHVKVKGPMIVNRTGSLAKLVDILVRKRILLKSEVNIIMHV